ncbi:MAG TPA: hypothetical protein VKI44_00795 [Acetobacteraceae bacterium]|nr:hypothetical protein [Acetobacteraceae bacterium]
MTRTPASKAAAAADALLDWLASQSPAMGRRDGAALPPPDAELPHAAWPIGSPAATALPGIALPAWPPIRPGPGADTEAVLAQAAPLRLPHTDWLYHHLTVTGPADRVATFARAAAGAGVIPWQLDLDRLAEDVFHALIAPPAPQQRSLSLAGARILADQLCAAVATRHALAVAQVGRSRACRFDLHALLPVPAALLHGGPDDPAALAWLWTHWGTTEALRHVRPIHDGVPDGPPLQPSEAVFRVSFWAADWTPWRALARLADQWPALRFTLQPRYDAT